MNLRVPLDLGHRGQGVHEETGVGQTEHREVELATQSDHGEVGLGRVAAVPVWKLSTVIESFRSAAPTFQPYTPLRALGCGDEPL